MKTRDYTLDTLKGLLAIGIVLIHTGSYVVGRENLSGIGNYIFSFTSLFVPAFFIISGYFFYKSKDRQKSVINLVKIYLIYSLSIVLFEAIFMNYNTQFESLNLLILGNNVGFFWFVNSLIYYMLFFVFVHKTWKLEFDSAYFLIGLILILNIINLLRIDHLMDKDVLSIVYFFSGYIISRLSLKLNWKFLFVIFLYPFFAHFKYIEIGIFTLFFASILVISFKGFNIKENYFSKVSADSLKILAVHYYIVNYFRTIELGTYFNYNYIILFLITISFTLIVVQGLNMVQKYFYKANSLLIEVEK